VPIFELNEVQETRQVAGKEKDSGLLSHYN
jgi:hypothetical protein